MTGHPSTALLVSIVIPTRNRASLIRESLESLWKQTFPASQWEIIVVDNCSTDNTKSCVEELAARSPCRIRYHLMDRDQGPAGARYTGGLLTEGKYTAFLDSDVYLEPDWLETAVRLADADAGIGILSGKLVYASQPEYVNIYGGALSRIGLAWDEHERWLAADITQTHDCLWVATGAVLVRTELLERLGGFDDVYYYGYEDSDFGWRVNLAGYACRCVPDLIAYHRVGDRPQARGPIIVFHSCKNRLRSLLKNYGASRLMLYLPLYLAYAGTDLIVRGPRWPKIKALLWNAWCLPETLRLRAQVQRTRTVRDRAISHLFSRSLFPSETVKVRHRRHIELHEGGGHVRLDAKS